MVTIPFFLQLQPTVAVAAQPKVLQLRFFQIMGLLVGLAAAVLVGVLEEMEIPQIHLLRRVIMAVPEVVPRQLL
jgi:hypothetical protein